MRKMQDDEGIMSGPLITNNDEVKVLTLTSLSISIGLEVRNAV